MSVPVPCLAGLPVEILEKIFLHLPGQDVIRLEAISRRFQDLTRNSPTLRYRCDLFSVGLIENPYNPCGFVQRRKLCEEHKRKLTNVGRAVKTTHELSEEAFSGWGVILCGGLIASYDVRDNSLGLLRILPAASRKPIEWWCIPPFPSKVMAFGVYLPENILAVAEEDDQSVFICFFNLSDGSPHSKPPSVIVWEDSRGVNDIFVEELIITGSRVMVHVSYLDSPQTCVRVWDWKTGDLVLNRTSVQQRILFTFLDEFRMMVLAPGGIIGLPEFTVFNTLVQDDHPVNSRWFRVPLRYHSWQVSVHVDGNQCLGTPDRDGPLITDPAQAVLVVELIDYHGRRDLIIVRVQTLIEHACSSGADDYVPWDEWGRDATVMEIPIDDDDGSYPLVHGAHVVLVKMGVVPRLRIFDFSRRGCSILPPWGEGDGAERMASFEGGQNLLLQGDEDMTGWRLDTLGNGDFVHLEEDVRTGSSGVLHVWELI